MKKKKVIGWLIAVFLILLIGLNGVLLALKYNENIKVQKQLDLGNKYLVEMQYEEAIACFEQIIAIEPKNVDAYIGLAKAYADSGDLKNAIKVLKKGYKQVASDKLNELIEQYEIELNREIADMRVVQVDTNKFPFVDVYFSVTDKNGELLSDITSEQLVLMERQPDDSWIEVSGNVKMTGTEKDDSEQSVAFVLDVSGSMSGSVGEMTEAAKSLLSQMKGQNYKVALTTFSSHVNTLSDYTTDLNLLSDMLSELRAGGGTAMYDALQYTLNDATTRQGKRCIIAFTDGDDSDSSATSDEIVSLAKYSNIPIYIICLSNYGSAINDMQYIAQQSGGEFYYIEQINDLYQIYLEIFKRQENLYIYNYETKLVDSVCDIKLEYKSTKYAADAEGEYVGQKPVLRKSVNNKIISNYYSSTEKNGYYVGNAFDNREDTVWIESAHGNGIGERINIDLRETNSINGISIYNGYRTSSDMYEKYGRVKTVKVILSNGTESIHELKDNFYEPSQIYFINPVETSSITLEIMDVYPGKYYQDTCISEIKLN